jgi:hypothetical protein
LKAPSPEKKKEAWREEKQDIGLATEEKVSAEARRGNLGTYSDNVVSRVKEIIKETKGRIISIAYDKQSGRPELIQLEIPAQQYKLFSAELAEVSVLQEPPPPISEADKDWVQIRLRFIKTE